MQRPQRKAKIEKGPLWGTKQTFFRRKEIRVSLLLKYNASAMPVFSFPYFFKKFTMGAG